VLEAVLSLAVAAALEVIGLRLALRAEALVLNQA
jgi:hypothetical protein